MEKLIHRIWTGPREMPERYVEYGKQWEKLNPGWELHDWDEDRLMRQRPINQSVIDDLYRRDSGRDTIELAVQMADVMSYELLWKYGGVYMNVDIEPIQPLDYADDLYGIYAKPWVCHEDAGFVVNAAMGCSAFNPFYEGVINALPIRYQTATTLEMNQTTGPRLLTAQWKKAKRGSVLDLPVEAFNPVHWRDVPLGGWVQELGPISTGTIGVHHWGSRMDQRSNVIEEGATWRQ